MYLLNEYNLRATTEFSWQSKLQFIWQKTKWQTTSGDGNVSAYCWRAMFIQCRKVWQGML